MVASAHRAGDRGPSRDGQRLSESRRDPRARARRPAERIGRQNRPFPTEVSTDLGRKTGHYEPGVSTDPVRPPPPGRAPSASACEPYRELIAEALGAWPQRDRDLAGPGRRPRLSRAVRECPPLRRDAARPRAGRGARRHHDGARRRRPGRLRRGADGPRPRAPASTDARASSS